MSSTHAEDPATPVASPPRRLGRWASRLARTSSAATVYTALAVVMTWPVARHITSRIAADLGDPIFNAWVLAWTTGQLLKGFVGDLDALANFWHANIFHPEQLTLAYSEHLFAQTLQVLPVQALTGNTLLSYNLLFISTFALSGLAVYVLVRDLTGRPLAAFLAGLAFAYAPYRMGQLSHLQVLSSYWMAFAIVGFRRYFVRVAAGAPGPATGRALAGGAVATILQNLSCGYYLLFFAPFAAAYCLYEMTQRRLLFAWRVWGHLALAAAFVGLATWPFLHAYLELREASDLGERTMRDLLDFSADTYAFVTAGDATRFLRPLMPGYGKPEGQGFPGFTILTFALIGLASGVHRLLADVPWASLARGHAIVARSAAVVFVTSFALLVWFFIYGQIAVPTGGGRSVYRDATAVLLLACGSLALAIGLVSIARRGRARPSETAFGFFALAALTTALLALGPQIEARGRPVSVGPYLWLFEYVPGFDGLRVPARFLMLTSLFVAVLAGLGAAALVSVRRALAPLVLLIGTGGMLAEGWIVPMLMNAGGAPRPGLNRPPPPAVGRDVPSVYEFIRQYPDRMSIAELPFGDPAWELMTVFYAGYHRKPVANGYSGMFPDGYFRNSSALRDVVSNPDRAIRALRRLEVTHVLVHERAWPDDYGPRASAWLISIGARPVAAFGSDRLFELRDH